MTTRTTRARAVRTGFAALLLAGASSAAMAQTPDAAPAANFVNSVQTGKLLFLAGNTGGAAWAGKGKVGRELTVEFVARIREERKFDTLDALKAEMARDMARAREILAARRFGDSGQIL